MTTNREPMALPSRVRVLVVFGGQSAEHDVSRISARAVLQALDPNRYEIHALGISREGEWVLAEGATRMLADGVALPDEGPALVGITGDSFAEIGGPLVGVDAEVPTVVFPVLHGPNGEDGTIQGMLELAGLPYVSSGVAGSAVSMDKGLAKSILAASGIPQARYRALAAWEVTDAVLSDIAGDLGYPMFVKPANMGSSVGVSKAADRGDLDAAVATALRFDERLVIEEGVLGREIEIGVLGNEYPLCSVPGEIVPTADFYDYDNKYMDGTAKLLIPAPLAPSEVEELTALAVRTYAALRAEVYARVDVFFEENGRGFLVNEINTQPGFTKISMFPQLWAASGLAYPQLIDEMIRLALERDRRRGRFG